MDMEEDIGAPETSIRRSTRPTRVPIRAYDPKLPPQPPKNKRASSRIYDDESDDFDDFSDDIDEFRPITKRNKTARGFYTVIPSKITHQTIIEIIKGSGKQIPQVVKRYVELYEKEPKHAMAVLLSMLFEACGAKYQILEEMLDETDVDDVVVALVNMAKKGEVEDYQNSKRDFKNFKENLIAFWDHLVTECQTAALFDKNLFDKCLDYIIALSCTPPRVYRHVASLMGLQLVTSFINIAKVLSARRETTRRQLDAEKKKGSDGPRVESLDKTYNATHEKITLLEEMMRKVFTGLFVHRYRDIDPDIRTTCIQSLGVWILLYPSLFLQDLYLKYLGWTLNDKSAGVRKVSVLALQNLYEVDDNVGSLALFTERFYKRMLELADDIDISVAVSAIGLVKQLLRHQLFPDEELGPLYDLLIDDPAEIRLAVGELVYDHLIAQKFNTSQPSSGDQLQSSEEHLSRILQILREFSADPILSTYVIDDVWEYMGAMKDWKCIISMLLADNSSAELGDVDATNLIRLLSASVRKAVGERIVPATDNRKQYHNKVQRDMFENNRRDITLALMKTYPQLLLKFMTDKAKVSPLIEIVLYMDLELYSLKRQEKSFKTVLQCIKEAFFKHGEKDALRSCVRAFNFCASESRGELKDFAVNLVKEVENDLITKLKSVLQEIEDDDDEYSMLVNLKRLYELHLSREFPLGSLYENFSQNLQRFRNTDDEVSSFLLLNMYLHVTWCLNTIMKSDTVSKATVSSLLSKRDTLFEELGYVLSTLPDRKDDGRSRSLLASWVCIILAELWSLFKKTSFASTKLESLGYCPDESTLRKFFGVCEKQLQSSDETEDEYAMREYIEETNRDAVMIAAAKLVATDTVPRDYLAPEIVSHLVMHGSSVSEIIKYLIAALKKKGDVSGIFLEALRRAYQRHLLVDSTRTEDLEAEKLFQECKDLASRLAGTFVGAARNKHRLEILNIVRKGIVYAFSNAPKHLSFLDCAILPFVSRLPTSDIVEILKETEKKSENVDTDADPSGWRPYFTFVGTLHEKYAKLDAPPVEKEGANVRRRGRQQKQQNLPGKKLFDEKSSSEEEDSISGSDQDAEEEEEDEEEDTPLIHAIRSSKLRSLRISKDGDGGPTKTGDSS